MVIGIIAGLHGITDEELNELALAVVAELSRRQAENLAAPELGAEPLAATSQAEAFFTIVGGGILRFVMITSTRLGAALSWSG